MAVHIKAKYKLTYTFGFCFFALHSMNTINTYTQHTTHGQNKNKKSKQRTSSHILVFFYE